MQSEGRMRQHIIELVIVLLTICMAAWASEWYENVPFVQNDPFQFDSQRVVLFPRSGLTLSGHPATGKMYAILPAATITRLQNDPKHLIVVDSHVLTSKEAQSYKNIFHGVSTASQVPWILGAIGAIPTPVAATVGVTSTLLDGLYRLAQANQKVSASALEQLMSAGGRFDLALLLITDPNAPTHQYICSSVVYNVKVGGEDRIT